MDPGAHGGLGPAHSLAVAFFTTHARCSGQLLIEPVLWRWRWQGPKCLVSAPSPETALPARLSAQAAPCPDSALPPSPGAPGPPFLPEVPPCLVSPSRFHWKWSGPTASGTALWFSVWGAPLPWGKALSAPTIPLWAPQPSCGPGRQESWVLGWACNSCGTRRV